MSANATLAALADERLDELLDDAAWDAAHAEHGADACQAALEAAQARRDLIAQQPRPELPPAVRDRIMAHVTRDQPRVTPAIPLVNTPSSDEPAAEVITPPASRWRAWVPALVAAAIAAAVLPILLQPEPPGDSGMNAPQPAAGPVVADMPAEATARAESTASSAADDATLAPSAKDQVELAHFSSAPSNSTRDKSDDALSIDLGAVASTDESSPNAPSYAGALPIEDMKPRGQLAEGPQLAEGRQLAEGQEAYSDADVASRPPHAAAPIAPTDEYADLLAKAQEWESDNGRRNEPGADRRQRQPLPAAVAAESMTNELERRGVEAEAAAAVVNASFRSDNQQMLVITMGLLPGRTDALPPELDVLVTNRGPGPLTTQDGQFSLEGLNGKNTVVWRTALPAPEGAIVPEGERLRWRVPLTGEQLPPAGVQALRLSANGQVGDIMLLEPEEP